MKNRNFPAAVIATATLALWVSSARSVAAQDSSSANTSPGAPAPEQVQLSGGAGDVLKLAHAKVNDDVTVAFVQTSDRRFNLTASEILYLRKEGVSDRVLTAMLSQQPTAPSPPPTAAPAASAPEASAPQYTTSLTTTADVETTPASTVYLGTPTRISHLAFHWVGVGAGAAATTDTGVIPIVTTVTGITIATTDIIRR